MRCASKAYMSQQQSAKKFASELKELAYLMMHRERKVAEEEVAVADQGLELGVQDVEVGVRVVLRLANVHGARPLGQRVAHPRAHL